MRSPHIKLAVHFLLSMTSLTFVQLPASDGTLYWSRDDLFTLRGNYTWGSSINKTRFTEQEKNLILQISNAYRSMVFPRAVGMKELIWDSQYEDYAYNHTQKCTGAHSSGTINYVTTFPKVYTTTYRLRGEVLYYRYDSAYSIEEAFYMFWAEGLKYDIYTDGCTHPQTCGHYRVLMNEVSYRMGCALNLCKKFTESTYPTPTTFIMCSYDGQYTTDVKPYTVGPAGSNCENMGYSFQYIRNNLCISPNMRLFKTGYDGNTTVLGFDYNDVVMVEEMNLTTPAQTTPPATATSAECNKTSYGRGCQQTCRCEESHTDRCHVLDGSCTCMSGWTGEFCQTDVNECSNTSVCVDVHETCVNYNGSFECRCGDGYRRSSGQRCLKETEPDVVLIIGLCVGLGLLSLVLVAGGALVWHCRTSGRTRRSFQPSLPLQTSGTRPTKVMHGGVNNNSKPNHHQNTYVNVSG
ncbi:cysteine-rich secretory protein LCCL domain-containing 2-like isoform X2 [Physella acuta]|uniref:cysteine-rich secretory protein LCCL domain-containing 2-like isoform X2 n=1 Tax=Physella acuta TaxID=109671 RepID=UPI0027DBE354|nr:cysteine-rich secretory protein LCCL domain-containing 2-like isoform X2 [Physella acuta]